MILSTYDHLPFTNILLSDASNLATAGLCLVYAGLLACLALRIEALRGSALALAILAGLFGLAFVLATISQGVSVTVLRAWLRLLFICFIK